MSDDERKAKQKAYRESHPWLKHLGCSYTNAKRRGLEYSIKGADLKELWFRDEAWKLKRPSLDRKESSLGYTKENCRFIELSENCAQGVRGRKVGTKQRESGRQNLKEWHRQWRLSKAKKSKHEGVNQ